MRVFCVLAAVAVLSVATAQAALFTIGGDSLGIGRRLTEINVAGGTSTGLLDLGDGSLSYSGLTYNGTAGRFYAVANDGFGASTLVHFGMDGATSSVMGLDVGGGVVFNGGLVYNPHDGYFYAIGNSWAGSGRLYRIDPGTASITQLMESMGPGHVGGLTVTSANTLATIQTDGMGSSSLRGILLSGGMATVGTVGADFGQGFYGGVYYDGAMLYGISSDPMGAGVLTQIMPGAPFTSTELLAVGNGYYQAGLTEAPGSNGGEVPEPGSWALLLSGLGAVAALRSRKTWRNR